MQLKSKWGQKEHFALNMEVPEKFLERLKKLKLGTSFEHFTIHIGHSK